MHQRLETLFDLTGRTAIVTGASRGLGRAMAIGLAQAAASVVVASRSLEACQLVAEDIVAAGGSAVPASVRMQDPDEVATLAASTVDGFGRIDIIVNNAVTVLDRGIDAVDPSTFHGAFGTNLLGPLLLVKAAKGALARHGHGSIINIVSVAACASGPGRYLYPPVKAALAQVTRSLARELAADGIVVRDGDRDDGRRRVHRLTRPVSARSIENARPADEARVRACATARARATALRTRR